MGKSKTSNHSVKRWPLGLAFALALVAIVAFSGGGASVTQNVHGAVYDWAGANPGQDVPILVQTDGESDAVAEFIRSSGGTVQRQFQIIPAVEAEVSPRFISKLAGHPDIAWISLDAPVISTRHPKDSKDSGDAVNVKNLATAYPSAVNAPAVWNGSKSRVGAGVTVAVLDSGITNDNADFKSGKNSRVIADVAVNSSASGFDDGYGHGTHVAGIIAGNGGALKNKKYIGIAPGANLVDVKLSDDDGNSSLADVIAGLEYVYNNKDALNIRVVNLSLTSSVAQSYTVDPLDAAVEFLWLNDIVVVVAAGNRGDSKDAVSYPPANDPFVIVTGAFDDRGSDKQSDDVLTEWSSRGVTQDGFSKPDLVAPGRSIVASTDTQAFLANKHGKSVVDDEYFRMSGTSMAAPVVSGIVALILEENPEFTPGQVKYVLMETARKISGDKFSAGGPLADKAVFFDGKLGNTDDDLSPALAFRAPVVVPPGLIAYVLDAKDPKKAAKAVGFDLQDAGLKDKTLKNVKWDSIRWDSIRWDAIRWDAIRWDAIRWDAIR
ncbi:MAG: S8 family peptidase, partial [Chloroflexi bacterium]|nr:S8 family peptidase [Chloroflexota bacterium]